MVQYSVTINIDQQTLDKLKEESYSLYVFKGINAGSNAKSTVWLKLSGDEELYNEQQITITWEEHFYIGETSEQIKNGVTVSGKNKNETEITFGYAYPFPGNWEPQPIPNSSKPGTFTIDNTQLDDNNFYVIQSGQSNGVASQDQKDKIIVVKTIPSDGSGIFEPIETVAFVFGEDETGEQGSIITEAFSAGAMVTLSGSTLSTEISYTREAGKKPWSGPPNILRQLSLQDPIYDSMRNATLQAQFQLRKNWFVPLESRQMDLVAQLSRGKNMVVAAVFLKVLDIAADTYIKTKLLDKFNNNLKPSYIDVQTEGNGDDMKVTGVQFYFNNSALILALAGTDAYESAVDEALTKAAQDPNSHILSEDWNLDEDKNWTYAPHNVESTAAYYFPTSL